MAFVAFELSGDGLPDDLRVLRLEGEEALNEPYALRILSVSESNPSLGSLDGASGQNAKLVLREGEGGAARTTYHGIVAALELVREDDLRSLLRLTLVPRTWRLGLGEHSRVFVGKSLPDILKETLEDGGMSSNDYDLRLTGNYPPLPHVCQYRESRLAFVTRWLERVGAYYFFEQGDAQEKLVITDDPSSQTSARGKAFPYRPAFSSSAATDEAFWSLRARTEALPKKVAVRDYNYEKPSLSVTGEADVVPGPGGEVHLFDVNVDAPADAAAHATTWARRYLSHRTTYRIEGNVVGIAPGFTFATEGHARSELDQEYLATRVRHEGVSAWRRETALAEEDAPGYRCRIEAVEAGQRWVPPAVTEWPRIAGSVRARVDGPQDSDYAQLDDDGRYLVRLLLDESGLPDGRASELVRMLQPHAGNPEGMHFPLRKGTEVQIAFLKGDPDQPFIAGVVPNAQTPSPVTQSNRSQNVLQTGGRNRLEIEDRQGSEYVDLSSPPVSTFLHLGAHAGLGTHNVAISTDGDYSMHTGTNRNITIGADQNEEVTGNLTETYHSNQTTTVNGALKETIDGGATQTISAGSTQTIDGGMKQTISGGEIREVTGGQTETLSGGRTQTITGSSTETIQGSLTQTITGGATITTPGSHAVLAAGGYELSTPATITLVASGGYKLFAPGGQTRIDDGFTLLGGKILQHGDSQLTFTAVRLDTRLLFINVGGFQMNTFVLKSQAGGQSYTYGGVSATNKGIVAKIKSLVSHKAGVQNHGG